MAESDLSSGAQSLETRADSGEGAKGVVAFWMTQLELASNTEKDWRERAGELYKQYRAEKPLKGSNKRFNILYSNTDTLAPALYNSQPVADVRRRFGDTDETGKVVSQVLERALSYSVDVYDFDAVMQRAVKDMLVPGRGVARIEYQPIIREDGSVLEAQLVTCRTVPWKQFRHGVAESWSEVPWVAFQHFVTREQAVEINPQIGGKMDLDSKVPGAPKSEDARSETDAMKRGTVWEIWDRSKRQVLFIAPAWRDAPLKVVDDPLGLDGFFPIPKPLYAMEPSDTMVPVEPYQLYKDLAEELDRVSRRISSITQAIKYKGVYYDPLGGDFMTRLESAKDGEFIPAENPAAMSDMGALDKAFYVFPVEGAAKVLNELFLAREQIKQSIYEITGIADIIRGTTKSNETATAQQIKSQWGSLRIQRMQAEVQRFARDLFRLKAEIMAEKFDPALLMAMTGIQFGPDVAKLLQSDAMRRFRVDIETDSTIRADVVRAQENIAQFVQGFGTFIQAVGPAVMQGAMPMEVATAMIKAFQRPFKLGREVEDALESMNGMQAPPQHDPNAAAAAEAQVKAAEMQQKAQAEQQKLMADMQKTEMQLTAQERLKAMELDHDARKHAETLAFEREKYAADIQFRAIEGERAAASEQAKMAVEHERSESDRMERAEDREFQRAASEDDRAIKREGLKVKQSPAVGVALKPETEDAMAGALGQIAQSSQQGAEAMLQAAEAMRQAAQVMAAPKRVIRGPDGRVAGAEAALN